MAQLFARRWIDGVPAVTALTVALALAVAGCAGPQPTTSSPRSTPSALGSTPSPAPASAPTSTGTPELVPASRPSPARSARITQRNPGWALDRIDQRRLPLNRRFTATGQGRGVTVYVVDGLFDVRNPEFEGRARRGLNLGRTCSLEDGTNHGLFVAGLVAGRRTGVAKKAKIVSVGSSYGCEGGDGATEAQMTARIVRALDWVRRHARKPAVVNLSLNVQGPAPTIRRAVKRLVDKGLTVVASAGNQEEDACGYPPAGLPGVITVTGSTKTDRVAGLNYGRCVDLFAPALGVKSVVDASLVPERVAVSEAAATSWAAPIVSGAAALYLSTHRRASPAEVKCWLIGNATRGVLRGDRNGSPNRLLYTGGRR